MKRNFPFPSRAAFSNATIDLHNATIDLQIYFKTRRLGTRQHMFRINGHHNARPKMASIQLFL